MSLIAAPHCDCAACRAAHWESDATPTIFSAHEVADAWQAGYDRGYTTGLRQVATEITRWIRTDDTPCQTDEDR